MTNPPPGDAGLSPPPAPFPPTTPTLQQPQPEHPPSGRLARWRELGVAAVVLAAFYLQSALYLRPIWSIWRTHIAPNDGDPVFDLWLLKWVSHEIGRGFAGYWDPPFFYPYGRVLIWSDHILSLGLVASVWQALVPGWVGTYNVMFLSSYAVTGAAMAWVLRRSGRSWVAAFLGGAIYVFSPFRWDQLPHLQVLSMAAIPLALWSFDRLLERPTARRAAAFLVFYALQVTAGVYLAIMLHVPLAMLALNRLAMLQPLQPVLPWRRQRRPQPQQERETWRPLLVLGAAALAAAAILWSILHFYQSAAQHLEWNPNAQRHWGATVLSYLQVSDSNVYPQLLPRRFLRQENCLFPGWLAVVLGAAALVLWRRRPQGRHSADTADTADTADATPPTAPPAPRWRWARWARAARWLPLALAVVGWANAEIWTLAESRRFVWMARWVLWKQFWVPLLLVVAGLAGWALLSRAASGRWPLAATASALAPWPRGLLLSGVASALFATPLIFLSATRVLPGLAAMRVPARFHAFTMVSIAFLAAAGWDALAARADRANPGRRRPVLAALLAAAAAAAVLFDLAPRPVTWVPLPEEAGFSPVYAWLAGQHDVRALLELPLGETDEERVTLSLRAMYYGTRHWHNLVNGYSAHFGKLYIDLIDAGCHPMPEGQPLEELQQAGVSHILIHVSDFADWQLQAIDSWAAAHHSPLLYSTADDRVYRLPMLPVAAAAAGAAAPPPPPAAAASAAASAPARRARE